MKRITLLATGAFSWLLSSGCNLDSMLEPNDNAPPVANAGPDLTVTDTNDDGAEAVSLDGSGSTDPDGRITHYAWTEGDRAIAVGVAPTIDMPTGVYTVQLVVTDDRGAFSTDEVIVTVLPGTGGGEGNVPPIASAGQDQVVVDMDADGKERVTLDASGSHDPDGRILDFTWTLDGRRLHVDRSGRTRLDLGIHEVLLTVTDDDGATATDAVTISVVPLDGNSPPIADAGPDQTVSDQDGSGSELVDLAGSGTDTDGTIVLYEWLEGSTVLATGVSARVPLEVGTHTITLRVTDDGGATGSDTVRITVSAPAGNEPPVADAGPDQTLRDDDGDGSELVRLDGTGSRDPDGTITAWTWSEGTAQLGTGPAPSVSLPVGTHTITLTVTDDRGDRDTDTVVIEVNTVAVAVSYSQAIQPYFDNRCVSCHEGGGPAGVDLDSWQHVMNGGSDGPLVVPGDSSLGTLLPKIRSGHKGAPHETNIEQDLVDWIDAGAPNN